MQNSVYLKIEVSAGSDIFQASKEAIALADRLQCNIDFSFNGVTCFARPGGDPNLLAKNYEEAVASKSKYKFAHSTHPKPEPVVEREWEIVAIRSSGGAIARKTLKHFDKKSEYRFVWDADPKGMGYYEDFMLSGNDNKIHSVKRLSDSVVFTIGDWVEVEKEDEVKGWVGTITEFWLTDGVEKMNIPREMHICYNGHHYDIKYFKKQSPPQPQQLKQPEQETESAARKLFNALFDGNREDSIIGNKFFSEYNKAHSIEPYNPAQQPEQGHLPEVTVCGVKYISPQQLNEEREKAFRAARMSKDGDQYGGSWDFHKYPTVTDFLNSIK